MLHILNTIALIIGWISMLCFGAFVGGYVVFDQQEKHVARRSRKQFDEIMEDLHADTD